MTIVTEDIKDEVLWRRCLEGDLRAFEALYKRYYALLFNYGNKIHPDKELVNDTIQDLFLKLITNHASLSDTKYIKGYLLKAYRNLLLDSLQSNENTFSIDRLEFSDKSPSYRQDDEELIEMMETAYDMLSARKKEIIYLYYIRGMSHYDIAEMLGINYQSSKNLLYRSLSCLRKIFLEKQKGI